MVLPRRHFRMERDLHPAAGFAWLVMDSKAAEWWVADGAPDVGRSCAPHDGRLPGGVVNAAGGHLPVLSGCGCGVSAEDFGSWRRAALCPDQTIRPKCWGSKFMEPSDARRASEAAQGTAADPAIQTVIGPSSR